MLAKSRGALVAIQARDFERAVTFYTAVLGLEMTFRHENFWAEFRASGLTLGISSAGDATVVGGGSTTVCFEVPAIESVVEGLRSRGVSFVGSIVEKFHGREAYFTDSEGNPLMLHQSSMTTVPAAKSARPDARPAAAKRSAGERSGGKRPSGMRAKTAARPSGKGAARKSGPRRDGGKSGRGKKGKR